MKFLFPYLLFVCWSTSLFAQNLYFPPINSNFWARSSPASQGWCIGAIGDLYDYLEDTNTKAFIVLKDGKIVLEKYFDNFTRDDTWYWASAGKCLTSVTMGIAQQQGLLSIEDKSSDYLGTGWTSLSPFLENRIKVRNQISMNTGLDESAGDPDCTDPACLTFRALADTRWAYHNAPYTLSLSVIEAASGQPINDYVSTHLHAPTGITGDFQQVDFNRVYYSTARSMARFGLLVQNNGSWDGTPVLSDANYFNDMLQSSSSENLSYGYLWWLNGYESHRLPNVPFLLDGPLLPDAPSSTVAALGKNGQILNVIADEGLIVVRMGASPEINNQQLIASAYNNEIWKKLNLVICGNNNLGSELVSSQLASTDEDKKLKIYPNPVVDQLQLAGAFALAENYQVELWNTQGRLLQQWTNVDQLDLNALSPGVYYLEVMAADQREIFRFVKQ